ncbi:MFS transporter, partial [archaeon]
MGHPAWSGRFTPPPRVRTPFLARHAVQSKSQVTGSSYVAFERAAALQTVVAGVGFLSDAYDLFVINMVTRVLAQVYPQSPGAAAAISTAALCGSVAGQLVCGALADTLGRRRVFILTLVLIVIGSLGSATCVHSESISVYTQLAIWRALLGFGVGGEYPLSATVTSEGNTTAQRGKAVASVFSMQGVGNILASLVMVVLLSTSVSLDATWRIACGIGALPGLLTFRWRLAMEESEHFVRATGPPAGDAHGAAHELKGDNVALHVGEPPLAGAASGDSTDDEQQASIVAGVQRVAADLE